MAFVFPGRGLDRQRTIVPLIIGAAAFMQAFDASSVLVALPRMAVEFGVPVISMNMVVVAYLIAATAFLPVCGWAADRFGARRMFLVAVAGFGLASLGCILAPSLGWLISARVVEGCMGALLLPIGRIIVLRGVEREDFAGSLAILTLPVMLGPLMGPTLGGLIVDLASWRWLFGVNIIVAVIGLWAVMRWVDEVPPQRGGPLDLPGFLLIGAALVGLTYGLTALARSLLPLPVALGLLVGGALCTFAYVRHCRRHAAPVLDFSSLRLPAVRATNIGGLFQRMIVSAVPFLLILLFQPVFGLDARTSGGLLFAGAMGALLGRWLMQPIVARVGVRRFLLVNSVLFASTVALCAAIGPQTPHLAIMALLFAQGAVRAAQLIGMMTMSYQGVPDREFGSVSTIASVSQQFALSIGIAIAVGMLSGMQALTGTMDLSREVIAPAFLLMAGLSLLSMLWFWPLPDEMGRKPRDDFQGDAT
jgi:EmrB/QacA subfamily drug resistance transporter